MRIAAIYWPTSSVGGIETELRSLRAEADRRGDTFHVLRSGKHKTLKAGLFPERKVIRGGDTFVTVDGEAPHHPSNVEDTLCFLHENYDRVYFAFLCPHATKDYGDEPLWLPLYDQTYLPITARITDGYWESYAHWGEQALDYADSATICQEVYRTNIPSPKVKVALAPLDFRDDLGGLRSPKRSTVWTSQWKAIKGIQRLLPHIKDIKGKVDMYSCGILYYQLRSKPEWKASIGKDLFKGFDGDGSATYHGWVPLERIAEILASAWFMIDLQGIGKPKFKVYQTGSVNLTTAEALHYGATPVLHRQAANIEGIEDVCLLADEASDVPKLINRKSSREFAFDPVRIKAAKKFASRFDVRNLYDKIVLGDFNA